MNDFSVTVAGVKVTLMQSIPNGLMQYGYFYGNFPPDIVFQVQTSNNAEYTLAYGMCKAEEIVTILIMHLVNSLGTRADFGVYNQIGAGSAVTIFLSCLLPPVTVILTAANLGNN